MEGRTHPMENLRLFSGNANKELAEDICKSIDIPLGNALVKRFSDGEVWVEVKENVRGRDVYIVQPTCPPVNDHLMELLVMIDAMKRASAERITAVIPYYGYSRQDRKVAPRTPISAKLVADLISGTGVCRVLCLDLHAGQIQGFFNIPVDNLFATSEQLQFFRQNFTGEDCVIIAPDAGGVERARGFAKRLHARLAIIDKRRDRPNEARVMNIIGDVKGKIAILFDDIVDTAGTLVYAANALMEKGASSVWACCTHGLLSGVAIERLCSSPIEGVVITNSIPLQQESAACGKIHVLSVANLLGEAIRRIYHRESVSSLFVK